MHESDSINGVNWFVYKFEQLNKCVYFFIDKYFTYKNNKYHINEINRIDNKNNEIFIEIHNDLTFIFQSKQIAKKFINRLTEELSMKQFLNHMIIYQLDVNMIFCNH